MAINRVVNQDVPDGSDGDLIYFQIPAVLKTWPNWVCYRHETNPKSGKTGNVP